MIQPHHGKSLQIKVRGETWLRYPVRTELVLPRCDYPRLYRDAVRRSGIGIEPDDLVVAGEKAIAVAEERAWHRNDIRVGWLARFLVRFVTKTPHGIGISSPETFQLAINEIGALRIVLAAIVGGLAKLVGIRGLFYRIAGRQVAMIDGAADYVIPPYNEYCSLGPKDPHRSARRISEALGGVRVAVVDANDLGVAVVGRSHADIDGTFIMDVLQDNPLGQTDEQTPLGIVRRKKEV